MNARVYPLPADDPLRQRAYSLANDIAKLLTTYDFPEPRGYDFVGLTSALGGFLFEPEPEPTDRYEALPRPLGVDGGATDAGKATGRS